MAVVAALSLGGAGCAQMMADVFGGGGGGRGDDERQEQTGWLKAKVDNIDRQAGTVTLSLAEQPADEDIELQSGRTFTVRIEHLNELTELEADEEEILRRMSVGEDMRVRLYGSGDEYEIREIDPGMLD